MIRVVTVNFRSHHTSSCERKVGSNTMAHAAARTGGVFEEPVTRLEDVWKYGSEPVPVGPYGLRRGHFGMFISACRRHIELVSITVGNVRRIPRVFFPDAKSDDALDMFSEQMEDVGCFIPDATVGLFLSKRSYDDSLHCIHHLDQELRGLAFIPDSRVNRGWQCAVYLNGFTRDEGHTFLLRLNGRDKLSNRHNRVQGKGMPGHLGIDLDYVLMTWLGLYPTSSESGFVPEVANKVLVLLCDWNDSYRWGERFKVLRTHFKTSSDDFQYPDFPGVCISADSFDKLRVVLVCRKGDESLSAYVHIH